MTTWQQFPAPAWGRSTTPAAPRILAALATASATVAMVLGAPVGSRVVLRDGSGRVGSGRVGDRVSA